MSSVTKRMVLVSLLAVAVVFAVVAVAYAAPLIPKGYGWVDGPHTSYPGYCLNCHTGFAAGGPPQITSGAKAPHHDRGSTCSQCHTIVTPPPPPPPPPVTSRVPITYLKGADRYQTAVEVSKKMFSGTAPAVVLATGANFPDALCSAPLAKAHGGPILLVAPGVSLDANVSAEVNRLHPATVLIVGGASAVSARVEAQVKALGWAPTVTRIAGGDRFETAAFVADAVKAKLGSVSKVVVANGMNYPDALSAAPLAAAQGWPILLANTSSLPKTTADALVRMGATSSLIAGGPSVVGTGVEALLPSPTRKGGADRYETCALLADYAASQGMTYGTIGVTIGTNFPDALAAGPMLAQQNGMLILAPATALPTTLSSRVTAQKMSCSSLIVIGGALSQASLNTVIVALN